jgi:peroxiredoxin
MRLLTGVMLLAASANAQSLTGVWSATVTVNDVAVPFKIGFQTEGTHGTTAQGWFFNGVEKVNSTGGTFEDGKLTLNFDQYGSRLEASLRDGVLTGTYGRTGRPPYPFQATTVPDISGNWDIPVKSPKGESAWHLVVSQSGPDVSAAILRIDGDTGALTGSYRDGKFVLSHFSGARPNLLEVTLQDDGSLQLLQNGKTSYTAVREAKARAQGLPAPNDPFHHTTVQDQAEPFRFSFPDVNGKVVSNNDPRFRGKVVVVAISGSWCPNCHDEAPYLESLYRKYREQGLEVVALSFEEEEQLASLSRLRAFTKEYGIDYTVLIPGEPGQLHDKLPQAVNLNSWPTTFFLGRDGRVRGVHAGFAGAASGEFNRSQSEEITQLVESLLSENTKTQR